MSTDRSPSNSKCTRKQRTCCCGPPRLTFKQWMTVCGSVLVPVVIAVVAGGLSIQQQHIAERNDAQKEAHAISTRMDIVLSDFIKQIIGILKPSTYPNGGSIPSDEIIAYYSQVINPLTIITAQQIDLRRKRLLFFFLVDSGLLSATRNYYINLPSVNFDNVDLSSYSNSHHYTAQLQQIKLDTGSFAGASFDGHHIRVSNMNFVNLDRGTFRRCSFYMVTFIESSLKNTDFTGAELFQVDFSDADLRGSSLTTEQLFESSNRLMGAALPNGSIIPVTNLLGMKHYAVPLSHSQQCQSGLVLNYYTKETGEVINVLTPDGQDCFFAGKLAFVESAIQQTVKVSRYSTWFSSGRVRYCLRATMGLTETDNKVGQSVKIVERAFDENKKVLHSAQLGEYNSAVSVSSPFTEIRTEKQCWPVPIGATSFAVELIFRNELAVNITDDRSDLFHSQTFGLIKDVFLTTE
ncbi:unnamed protein product [Adineta ricciae]|uniref:Uncharacterized protein n=2 Tax=Adineta ricciae TaxID=249248 RepID=A0A814P217_ADIRI|nr:unnamed protein product [Adineta ricciae]CAF1365059.1 unnamed protein product [Adineta ricciae]